MHVSTIVLILSALCSTATPQRTARRTCDCEPTLDGRCAYTLVLPASGNVLDGGACSLAPKHERGSGVDDGSSETGSSEAGSSEAGSSEAGSSEAGSSDAGSSEESSREIDPDLTHKLIALRKEVVELTSTVQVQQSTISQIQGAVMEIQTATMRYMLCNTPCANVSIDVNITGNMPDFSHTIDYNHTMDFTYPNMTDIETGYPVMNASINVTMPEHDFNITMPDMDHNFTIPDPEININITQPDLQLCCMDLQANMSTVTNQFTDMHANIEELSMMVEIVSSGLEEALPMITTLPETQTRSVNQ